MRTFRNSLPPNVEEDTWDDEYSRKVEVLDLIDEIIYNNFLNRGEE